MLSSSPSGSDTALQPADLRSDELRKAIRKAAGYLPTQGPIEVFVYTNPLQAFEQQSFHDGVKAARQRYHAEPYVSESEFRRLYTARRITDLDLEWALKQDCKGDGAKEINGLGSLNEIRLAMLRHPMHIGPDAELKWVVAETDALDRFRPAVTQINRTRILTSARKWLQQTNGQSQSVSDVASTLNRLGKNWSKWPISSLETFALHLMWRVCQDGVAKCNSGDFSTPARSFVRPRDLLLHSTGQDIDRFVHEVLIRFCAAYVDQGYSDWLLPNRDAGFYESFTALYSETAPGLDRWLRPLPEELRRLNGGQISAEQSIEESLLDLEIADADRDEFIAQSLLALGGWAGMIWQLESGVDWVVHSIPKGSLAGMLAVQLILERMAIRYVAEETRDQFESVPAAIQSFEKMVADPAPMNQERRSFLLFQVAQMLGWTPLELLQLSDADWSELNDVVQDFSEIERRHVFQEAYEYHYRRAALDAFGAHATRRRELPNTKNARPKFQIMTCIDDREESFRRHLEEVQPECETIGAAGFFAVAMYYRGAADSFYKPLCPAVIKPAHYVQEDVGYTFEGVHQSRAQLRRRLGIMTHLFRSSSRTFLGGVATGLVGSFATAPLVARVLFPRMASRIRQRFGSLLQPPPVTRLQLERYASEPGPSNGHIGYSIDEMADVVVRLLQDIGQTKAENFSRLFIVCGHGSSSLNNPHESSYCCGACAGKRGGPNARAFAQMANDWRVRTKVAARGISIPEDTVFVGAYHNTCDDSVVFYDLDRMPASHRLDFESARASIEQARQRNAHERCRRFASAPLTITVAEAIRHVEGRSQDISQPRPEYDHSTNSLCLVGRRDWSRGLFLDRRAFLTSYDPTQDDADHSVLLRILSAAIPVAAGINLSFYFSTVDNVNYGSGSKLPHNVVSLLGVMEGTSSDLRTGVYQQVVEIHEPVRLLFVIETTAEAMLSIMERNDAIGRLVKGQWVHLAVIDADTSQMMVFNGKTFEPYQPGRATLKEVESSHRCYSGSRDHLPFCSIKEAEVLS